MSDPMTPERIAKLRAAATFEHADLMDALAEIERLRHVLLAISDHVVSRIAEERDHFRRLEKTVEELLRGN